MQTAFDRRRINGPEDSFPPVWDAGDDDKASTSTRATRALGDTRSICECSLATERVSQTSSPEDRSHKSGQWLRIHRDRKCQSCLRGVSESRRA